MPLDGDCGCYTCRHFSRAICVTCSCPGKSGFDLNTIHNIHFYLDFMAKIRYAIQSQKFIEFKENF